MKKKAGHEKRTLLIFLYFKQAEYDVNHLRYYLCIFSLLTRENYASNCKKFTNYILNP